MIYPNGSKSILSTGPWAQLLYVTNCPCDDGKRRTVRNIGVPDTAWTCPGSVTVKGKSVRGFISCDETGYHFTANRHGKNYHLLPQSQGV